jgi:hypothetical protein
LNGRFADTAELILLHLSQAAFRPPRRSSALATLGWYREGSATPTVEFWFILFPAAPAEPLFSVGNVATVVKRGNERLAFYNQTTDRWFHYKLGLTLKQMGVVAGAMVLLMFLLWKTFWAYWDSSMSRGFFFFPDFVVELVVLGFYASLLMSLAFWVVRFIRAKRQAVKDGVMAIIREEAVRYAGEITRSKEVHKKMVDDL